MKFKKSTLIYVLLILAIGLTSIATTLALVTDEFNKESELIKFDKVSLMGDVEGGSNLSFTLLSDYVGDGEIVFNGSGEDDSLWIRASKDSADMFVRFQVMFTLGNEELDEQNKEVLSYLNNDNGIPKGFELFSEDDTYSLTQSGEWVYFTTKTNVNNDENQQLKVIQNSTLQDKNYIISNLYRLSYEKDYENEIFELLENNENQIILKVYVEAIQCYGLKDSIANFEDVYDSNNVLNSSNDGISLEDLYGNVTVRHYEEAYKQNLGTDLPIKPVSLEKMTWSEISILGTAIANGTTEDFTVTETTKNGMRAFKILDNKSKVSQTLALGDTKNIKVNGENIPVEIIGFNHDRDELGNLLGITFDTKDTLSVKKSFFSSATNVGGYFADNNILRNYLKNEVYLTLETELKNAIVPAQKHATVGNTYKNTLNSLEKIWALSYAEVVSTVYPQSPHSSEGRLYEFYTIEANRVKNNIWNTRTSGRMNSNQYVYINEEGIYTAVNGNFSANVVFAFCIGKANNVKLPTIEKTNFNDLTWGEIKAISNAISQYYSKTLDTNKIQVTETKVNNLQAFIVKDLKTNIATTVKLKDTKTISIKGYEDINMRVVGFHHDNLNNDKTIKSGITFDTETLLGKNGSVVKVKRRTTATNSGGYFDDADIFRNFLHNEIYLNLDEELKVMLEPVLKGAHKGQSTVQNMGYGYERLWGIGVAESNPDYILDTASQGVFNTETQTLPAIYTSDNATRIKKYKGVAYAWWRTSAYYKNSTNYYSVDTTGLTNNVSATSNLAVCFGFSL